MKTRCPCGNRIYEPEFPPAYHCRTCDHTLCEKCCDAKKIRDMDIAVKLRVAELSPGIPIVLTEEEYNTIPGPPPLLL